MDRLLKRVADAVTDENFRALVAELHQIEGVTVDVTFDPDTAGGDTTVQHDLGVVPTSWAMEAPDRPGHVFQGATANTNTRLYLQTDTPGLQCTIRVRP